MIRGHLQFRDAEALAAARAACGQPDLGDADGPYLRLEVDTDDPELHDAARALAYDAVAGSVGIRDVDGWSRAHPCWVDNTWDLDEVPGAEIIGSAVGITPLEVEALAFSPDGATLAVGCCEGWSATVLLVDVATGRERHRLQAREGQMGREPCDGWLGFLADGSLVTAGRDASVRRWDPQTGLLLGHRALHDVVRSSAAAGTRIVVVLQDGTTLHLDPQLEAVQGPSSFEVRRNEVVDDVRAYSPDGRRLALARRRRFHILDLDVDTEITSGPKDDPVALTSRGTRAPVRPDRLVAVTPDGRAVVVADDDLWTWSTAEGERIGTAPLQGSVYGVTVCADAVTLVVQAGDVRIVDGGSGLSRAVVSADGTAGSVSVANGAPVAAVLFPGREVVLVDLTTGAMRRWQDLPEDCRALALSDDGTLVIEAGEAVVARDAATGEVRWTLDHWAHAAAVSPGGDEVAIARGGAVWRLRAADGAVLDRAQPHPTPIEALAYADDGALVTVSWGYTLRWPPRGGGRPPGVDTVGAIRAALAAGARELAAAAAAASSLAVAPWRPEPTPWPTGGHPLPPVSPTSRPAVHGELAFWGPEAAANAAVGLEGVAEVDGAVLRFSSDRADVDREALAWAAERAFRGGVEVRVPGAQIETHTAGSRSPRRDPLEVPFGARWRFPSWETTRPWTSARNGSGAYRWFVEPLPYADGEEGDDDGLEAEGLGQGPVCRLRVVDGAGRVRASQRLPFEPEVHVSPSGELATFQASDTQRHLARISGQRDSLGVVILDAGIDEVAHLHPAGRVREIRTPAWASDGTLLLEVRTDDEDRLEAWDPRAGTLRWSAAPVGSWAVVGADRLVAELQDDEGVWSGLLLDAVTGERLATVGPFDDVQPLPDGGFATGQDLDVVLRDGEGSPLAELRRPARGARLVEAGWAHGNEAWTRDGAPMHEPAPIAVAFDGRRLASLSQREIVVREVPSGEVLLRGGSRLDWDWEGVGEARVVWLEDRVVLCVDDRIRLVDPQTGAAWVAAPSALVAITVVGAELVTAHRSGRIRRWNRDGVLLHESSTPPDVRRVAVDGDRVLIATDHAVHLPARGLEIPLADPRGRLGIALRGDRIAVVNDGVRVYGTDGALIREICENGGDAAAFTADGRMLAVARGREILQIDPASGETLATRVGHHTAALCVASGDLVSAGDGITIWAG